MIGTDVSRERGWLIFNCRKVRQMCTWWLAQMKSKCCLEISGINHPVTWLSIPEGKPRLHRHIDLKTLRTSYSKPPICNNSETEIMKMKRIKEVNFIFCSSEPSQILYHLWSIRGPPFEKLCFRPTRPAVAIALGICIRKMSGRKVDCPSEADIFLRPH